MKLMLFPNPSISGHFMFAELIEIVLKWFSEGTFGLFFITKDPLLSKSQNLEGLECYINYFN